ncbi:hypothetical protein KAR91_60910 [Candidatus Pacearchaeota archaeon]|nr:hypothetical protein [Candidatus Pacearchaeota archaeon]
MLKIVWVFTTGGMRFDFKLEQEKIELLKKHLIELQPGDARTFLNINDYVPAEKKSDEQTLMIRKGDISAVVVNPVSNIAVPKPIF